MDRDFHGSFSYRVAAQLLAMLVLLQVGVVSAQTCVGGYCWKSDYRPSDPIAFVAVDNVQHTNPGAYARNFSLDAANALDTNEGGYSQLYLFHPNRSAPNQEVPIRVFPLESHFTAGLIDAPAHKGMAVEPNAALNGHEVLFGYWHDASGDGDGNNRPDGRVLGADIYKIDLLPLIQNPEFPPANLVVTRLTDQPRKLGNRNLYAQNPSLANSVLPQNWNVANVHAVEMMTDKGLRVVYVSDKKRVKLTGALSKLDTPNLFIARYGDDGRLVDDNQFQYFTTSGAISPTNFRNGISFSYQSSTMDGSMWAIQGSDSSGVWRPVDGHGGNHRFAWHLQTLCSTSHPDGDFTVTTVYYRNNNNGSGPLYARPQSTDGQNHDLFPQGSYFRPEQVGRVNITPQLPEFEDLPSPFGKFSTPRCGRRDQLYAAHTWTEANHRNGGHAPGVNEPYYDFHIVYRGNVTEPSNVSSFLKVIGEETNAKSLLWPTPLVSFSDRFGVNPSYSYTKANLSGMPESLVGTSALYNTDVVPGECRMSSRRYDPTMTRGQDENHKWVRGNTALLNYVRDPNNIQAVCSNPIPLNSDLIFGIAINQTHTATDRDSWGKETKRILGVVPTVNQRHPQTNQRDQSFAALIPSKVPFEFHLLSSLTGLKLTDVRSWHSLYDGEVRTDCGGCHQHNYGNAPVPFTGTFASLPQYPTADLVNTTPLIRYRQGCVPEWYMTNQATASVPLWDDGSPLYTKFQSYCGSCHSAGHPSTADDAFIIGASAEATWNEITKETGYLPVKRFIDIEQGAHESPLWWAARGMRADGRHNDPNVYSRWYTYNSAHDSLGLCNSDPQWVYELGLWIDNHAPSGHQFRGAQDYNFDRFPPTATGALADQDNCSLGTLKTGFWDDTGRVRDVSVTFSPCTSNCTVVRSNGSAGLPNGFELFDLSRLQSGSATVTVTVTDLAGNRQVYTKSRDELLYECQNGYDPRSGRGILNGGTGGGGTPTPSVTPTPTPSGTTSPTPTPGITGSPTPTPGDGGTGEVRLQLRPGRKFKRGAEVRITVSAPSESVGERIVVGGSVSGTTPGVPLGAGLHLSLNLDDFFNAAVANLQGVLAARGMNSQIEFVFIVPKRYQYVPQIHFQAALIKRGAVVELSNVATIGSSSKVEKAPRGGTLRARLIKVQKRLRALRGQGGVPKGKLEKLRAMRLVLKEQVQSAKGLGERLLTPAAVPQS